MKTGHHRGIIKWRHALYLMAFFSFIPFVSSTDIFALTYQDSVDVSFTIQDTITISLSSPNLVINDLIPGTAADSNIITINILSNNPYGYTLNSTVGNSTYDSRNLAHTSSVTAMPFSSLDYGSSIADKSNFNPNEWGYSYSDQTVASPAWSSYSGLPLYSDETNIATLKESSTISAVTGDDVNFKIAAKAASAQTFGEYRNIINFTVIGAPTPFCVSHICMQDLSSSTIASLLPDIGSTAIVYDARDGQAYPITKLADNKYWMTTNLNLAGGTTIESTLSDVPEGYVLPLNNGFQDGNKLPESSADGFNDPSKAYVYNSGSTTCGGSSPCYSYYSWVAATLGSGLSMETMNDRAPYSVCPKGWKIPKTFSSVSLQESEFYSLMYAYGMNGGLNYANADTIPDGATIYRNVKEGTVPNFALAGYYNNSIFCNGGEYGLYWSPTVIDRTHSFFLAMTEQYIYTTGAGDDHRDGGSVRCIFNN
ncbi:MAG: hypothetical protein K6G49_01965 [Candidatus Saccharibacteria bacterium]|nr:hypothetical protein [Candidatus Saccharibacteria bacterium]